MLATVAKRIFGSANDRYVALQTEQWEWEGKVQGADLSTRTHGEKAIAAPGGA